MTTPVIARWDDLRSLLQSARRDCIVFSPFYSSEGLTLIDNSLRRSVPITFWTRLSLRDWASGVSNPEALCSLLIKLDSTRRPPQLFTNRALHAKAYFADTSSALVGSANLSRGGFETNVELMVHLEGENAETALKVLTVACSPRAIPVNINDLSKWVSRNLKLIKRAKANLNSALHELDVAQQETDTEIGEATLVEPTQTLLEEFVQWLAQNRSLPGAAHLVTLHNDRVVQRQQGHVKQCFSGVFRFLQEYPSWIQKLSDAAEAADGMIAPGGDLLRDWSSHLQTHANASSDLYSYTTLRAELPPSRGGTHRTGGGAGTTLRRVFPLVARFLSQRGHRLKNQA